MKPRFAFFAFILSACSVAGQQVTFQKTYGTAGNETGYSVVQTSDGGYMVAGRIFSLSDSGTYLLRLDTAGVVLWNKVYAINQSTVAFSNAIKETFDGGFIIAGYSFNNADSSYNIHLIKTDAQGDTLWTKFIGGLEQEVANAVIQTSDSGYAITGLTDSYGAGEADVYLIKTNSSGNVLWSRTYGALGHEQGYDVKQTLDGGFIITGYTDNAETTPNRAFLIRTNTTGNLVWVRQIYQTDATISASYGYSVIQTADSGFVFTGVSRLNHVYLVKIASAGYVMWARTFGGSSLDYGHCIKHTADNGFIIAGYTQSFNASGSVYLIKTTATGNLLWSRVMDGTGLDDSWSVATTQDGGYVIAGFTASFGAGSQDVYVIKTDSMGNSGCNQLNHVTSVVVPPTVALSSPITVSTGDSSFSQAITVNSSAVTATTMLCSFPTTVDEAKDKTDIALFPNPFSTHTKINFAKEVHNATFSLYNLLLEKVKEISGISGESFQLDRGNLPSGVYVFEVISKDKRIARGKAVVY